MIRGRKYNKFQRRWFSRFGKARSGATAVEFAMTAPVLLLFIYGMLELARGMFTQAVLIYSVQEASRYAAAHSTSTVEQITAVVQSSIIGIDPDPIQLTVTPVVNADNTRLVTVTITYVFTTLLPLFGVSSVTLDATSSAWAG